MVNVEEIDFWVKNSKIDMLKMHIIHFHEKCQLLMISLTQFTLFTYFHEQNARDLF